ncbi:hypothetical protein T484DRAFT_1799823, partial [Baffinella frigidus]
TLSTLSVSQNRLKHIDSCVGECLELKQLFCDGNLIAHIPNSFADLTKVLLRV